MTRLECLIAGAFLKGVSDSILRIVLTDCINVFTAIVLLFRGLLLRISFEVGVLKVISQNFFLKKFFVEFRTKVKERDDLE